MFKQQNTLIERLTMKQINQDIKWSDRDILTDNQCWIFWFTQEEIDSNNLYGNCNKQSYHHENIIAILDATMYQEQLVPKFLMAQLIPETWLIYYGIVL